MATEAKLRANANYLSKFKTLSVRVPAEDFPALEAAAAAQGESPSGYILEAARLRLARDAARADTVAAERAAAARIAAPAVRHPAPPDEDAAEQIRAIADPAQRKAAMIAALRGE